MTVWYNEFDPYAAAWLRNLIAAGHLPAGEVDERDIREVSPSDLRRFTQCHFFAGIGGWPLALKLAGWGDRPAWTGSCPCQPFSAAGQRKGTSDERHLWPEFFRLIAECRPATIFGEQVASKDGRQWLAGVRTDLEGVAYAVGAADLCAASVGAPHIRQRLWWVADSNVRQPRNGELQPGGQHGQQPQDGIAGGMGDAGGQGSGRHAGAVSGAQAESQREGQQSRRVADKPVDAGAVERLEHATSEQVELSRCARESRSADFWSAYDIVPCEDGKARRIEPGTFPLAHGVPARVGKLRAYGNAIVPQTAQIFIESYLETCA
jgi:DNA (cytosine-5)-methyltransferase 1